ncbi:hypothetical protein MWU75_03865 [Ornithinimicrobium sp. F0845]|uniref:ATP-grasp fold amidoligase family protein n=1 Tax=Ornithinimicrobium sp. F0845 TaxID=2926412 RepID=UPI001FF1FB8A|nr:ATP-grasp fold amidoligase family protein [Ornithinimicrobium sp. F0845]MCK0111275.1 hypothetical protein [Ornithinimicrobium sp. F0845]
MGLRRQFRRLPPIAWRDARLAELRQSERSLRSQLRELQDGASRDSRDLALELKRAQLQLATVVGERDRAQAILRDPKYTPREPSWHTRVAEQTRVGRYTARRDTEREYPRFRLEEKLHNYELARSYGVPTPRVIGSWPRIEEVAWQELPESFVVKSDRGYSGTGVLPLRRHGDRFRLIDSEDELSVDEIVSRFRQARHVTGPYFVEELLPGTGAVLPDDIKIFAFYGEVADVMVRRVAKHADLASFSYRFLDAEGTDRGQVKERLRHDPGIEVPRDLGQMVEVSRVLSTAVPVPCLRVDLYQVPDGMVLGELTFLPGSSETYTVEHDRLLGRLYDEAESRLNLDFARGRPHAMVFGPHSRDLSAPIDTAGFGAAR